MKLGLTFGSIKKPKTLEKRVRKVKKLGFTTVELSGREIGNVRELVSMFNRLGISVYGIGNYSNPIHPDEKIRNQLIQGVIDTIKTVAELRGPPFVIIGPSGLHSGSCWNIHRDNYAQDVFKMAVKNLRKVCKVAEEYNVPLALEPGTVTVGHSGKALLKLIKWVGYDQLYVHMDLCNMMSLERYLRGREYLNELFDELHGKICGAHLKDVHAEGGFNVAVNFLETVPGDGELPWEDYLFRLDGELGRDGPAAIEHITDPDIPRAKTFIETVAKKIGITWTN